MWLTNWWYSSVSTIGNFQPLPTLPSSLKPLLREVSTLASWTYCFPIYVAIRSTDLKTQEFLAYARLIICEARRHGGTGWLDYDRVFCQQQAIDPSLCWNTLTLHGGTEAATLLGQAPGRGAFCTLCREPDHSADTCALMYLQQTTGQQTPAATVAHTSTSASSKPKMYRLELCFGVCISWNKGKCTYPWTCTFRHICYLSSVAHGSWLCWHSRWLEVQKKSRHLAWGKVPATMA